MAAVPNMEQVQEARELLRPLLPVTRLIPAKSLSRICGSGVLLKLESDLPTGSFKPRGALYALHRRLLRGPVREVVASSTGNHGAAVAYAARLMGIPARIFLPANPNPVKRGRIAEQGAAIVESGRDITAAFAQALDYAGTDGVYFLNDASDPDLPAGPATIACEILEQAPQVRCLVMPMGDTALIRGVAFAAKYLRPETRIIGVQAERAPSYFLSWTEGRPIGTESCDTIADGLATRTPLPENVRAIRELVDEVRLVGERQLVDAVRFLSREEQVTAEPSGAAATAALLSGTPPGVSTALLVTGGNISDEVRALTQSGVPALPAG